MPTLDGQISMLSLLKLGRFAGLGNTLIRLLTQAPQLLQTTSAARVLQLLMERQLQSSSAATPLIAAVRQAGLADLLVQNLEPVGSMWLGVYYLSLCILLLPLHFLSTYST